MKPRIAIVRGKFLNAYEMQIYAPLAKYYDITGFGSLTPYHERFSFPVVKLASPMDIPNFRYKMPVLNRLCIDAHYLVGLENRLKGFNLVHTAETYFHYTQQCLNAKKKGYVKKVIATVLENIPFNNEGIWGRRAYKKRAREELDHIIALTHKTKEVLLLEGCDSSKITVIGHGIDTRIFTPRVNHWKHISNPDSNTFNITYSGRLETYKGVYDLLNAVAILLKDKKITQKMQFVFIGQGSEYKKMLQKEQELGISSHVIHRQVPYEHMPEAYRSADIVVAPSMSTPTWQEQYCTALLEAQSMGIPILTTRSGGIPENVGNSVLFVDEHDPEGIAHALKNYIEHPFLRLKMAKRARKRAENVHDVRLIAESIKKVYESVL